MNASAKTIRDLAEALHWMKRFVDEHGHSAEEKRGLFKKMQILLCMEDYELEVVEEAKSALRDFVILHNRSYREQTEMLEHLSTIFVSPTIYALQIRGEDL